MAIDAPTAHRTAANPADAPHGQSPQVQRVDVLIVGAGISGIGAAWYLQQRLPGRSFAILESQAEYGGTWRTHTYPGIRSDSDLFTFGYGFKPWMGKPIATAGEILKYMGEVIDENDLARHIRYRHRIVSAGWDSAAARWTVQAEATDAQGRVTPQTFSAAFLWMCQGYYRHSPGYQPTWPGMADFKGTLVHPQAWPAGLDTTGKRVVVIGSGATAATVVPALAGQCAHVTMLQRSPTYFITGRNANDLANTLRELEVPPEWTHEIVRRKILFDQKNFTARCFSEPEVVKGELLAGVTAALGGDDRAREIVAKHFTPRYLPWRQRVAFVPDADLFKAVQRGEASVVTDEIERFESGGLRLKSGELLPADIVVSATGFNLNVLGDIAFTVDGEPVDFSQTVSWRGILFTGLPNMAWVFGYFRASWTLRADLIGEFVCRLLSHMDERGARTVVPELRPEDEGMALKPWVDPDNFNPGYIQRGVAQLPKQGDRDPWIHSQDYPADKLNLPKVSLDDGSLNYR